VKIKIPKPIHASKIGGPPTVPFPFVILVNSLVGAVVFVAVGSALRFVIRIFIRKGDDEQQHNAKLV
jgi:hypothetical protein